MFTRGTPSERRPVSARRSHWRAFAAKLLLFMYCGFCGYQLYTAVRYGVVLPAARHHRGAPYYIYYREHNIAFIFSLLLWELPLAIGIVWFILSSLGQHTPWERRLVK